MCKNGKVFGNSQDVRLMWEYIDSIYESKEECPYEACWTEDLWSAVAPC